MGVQLLAADVASFRSRVRDGGYLPVPVHTGEKRPKGNRWQDVARLASPVDAAPEADALNTGILCDGLRVVDIDVDDPATAHALRSLATQTLGETIVRTRDNSSRLALIYRAEEGQPVKRTLPGSGGKVEVLGLGQQLLVDGLHPSGAVLRWDEGSPCERSFDQLPTVSEDAVAAFLLAAAPLIGADMPTGAAGLAAPPGVSLDGLQANLRDVSDALYVIPNNGPASWEAWNRVGMAAYAASDGAAYHAWLDWSARHPAHDPAECADRWKHFRTSPPDRIGAGTLFHMAREADPHWTKPTDRGAAAHGSEVAARLLASSAAIVNVGGWSEPRIEVAKADTLPPPPLPLDVFPPFWAEWIADAALAAGAPADYVAAALLSAAGALIGNARWPQPKEGWREPPILNVALIGLPSAHKSPAFDTVVRPMTAIENAINGDWADRQRDYAVASVVAAERKSAWTADVRAAVKQNTPPPPMPEGADEPAAPERWRIVSTDPTVAKAERMSAANPRGLLLQRDELAGWLSGMDRFNGGAGGSDRAFWLQAYGGRVWQPDRVKDAAREVSVPHLTWAIAGGIQPDKLTELMLAGADDGLSARFLYVWPEGSAPTWTEATSSLDRANEPLARLHGLTWEPPEPVYLPFTAEAKQVLQTWRERVHGMETGAGGLFLSWVGKLPGFAVRLACVLAHLDWCAFPWKPEVTEIDATHVQRAVRFLDSYAVPMARRTFGEGTLPVAERDARRLARWLVKCRPVPAMVNARELRRMANGPGIKDAGAIEAALAELAALGIVRETPISASGKAGGRSRGDWQVNSRLHSG